MYLSADDARSDFFLAAAAYVIGPSLLALLLNALPGLLRSGALGTLLTIASVFLTTAAMPLFLLRYREESFASLRTGGSGSLLEGAALTAVFAVPLALAGLLESGMPLGPQVLSPQFVVFVVVRWLSLAVLAVFLYRRAEYAFRPISESQQTLVHQAGLACSITAGVSTLLLLLADRPFASLVPAAGLIGWFFLAERRLPQHGMGERWWVWAPVITLALGPLEIFGLLFGGADFIASAQQASVAATFGLVTVMALHARRGALFAVGIAVAFVGAQVVAPMLGGLVLTV